MTNRKSKKQDAAQGPFATRFLKQVGYGRPMPDRALDGQLPTYLSPLEIAVLATGQRPETPEARALETVLTGACNRGEFPNARNLVNEHVEKREGEKIQRDHAEKAVFLTPPERKISHVTVQKRQWFIHRDEARRYFMSISVMPDEGTPLWCWLKGTARERIIDSEERSDEQDKADFQQACVEHWKVSPTTTITSTKGCGIVDAVGGEWGTKYSRRYLEGWAREVAPPGVRDHRGRRRKISAEEN